MLSKQKIRDINFRPKHPRKKKYLTHLFFNKGERRTLNNSTGEKKILNIDIPGVKFKLEL